MKKKIIIISSFMILFLVSLIVYTKAENKSTNNKKGILNWKVNIFDGNRSDFIETEDGYILSSYGSITKYDKKGNLLWKNDNYDGDEEGAMEIIPTKDEGYITYGYIRNNYILDIYYDDNSKKITKYDKDGKKMWRQENNSGYIYDVLSVDDGVIALSSKGLTKYNNSDGTVIWDTTKDNDANNELDLDKVIETEDGYVAVVVTSENVDNETTKYITNIVKYGKDGKIIWNKQYNNIFCYIDKMLNTGDGYIVVGRNKTETGFVASMAKIDKSGAIKWQKKLQEAEHRTIDCFDVAETNDGYIVVGDKIIVKYNKNGEILWKHEYKDRYFRQILVNGDKYIVGCNFNGIGTIFIYSKDGELLDYHHVVSGDMIKFTTNDDLSNYTVLTGGFFVNYSTTENLYINDTGTYDVYKIGDVVEYNDNYYYVIENSDSNKDYVTLLKAENLTSDEINKYKGDIQVKENRVPFYTSDNCYYNGEDNFDENGCVTDYKKSFVQQIIENWASDALREEDLAEIEGYKVRSIKTDELINNLGYYFGVQHGTSWGYCFTPSLDSPAWASNVSTYWTMSGYEDGNNQIYSTSCVAKVHNTYGIRPVINLKKIAIKKHSSNGQLDNNLYCENGYDYEKQTKYNEFNTGDEIKYNGENYYVIENSDNNTKYVTLLKDDPLTAEEVNKYNGGKYESKDGEMPYLLGCDSTHLENCINLYDESLLKKVIDNWSSNLKDLVKVDGYKARLITIDEILNNMSTYPYQATPSNIVYMVTDNWVYNNSYSYWTMSPYGDSVYSVYGVDRYGELYSEIVGNNLFVRPVINLDKCAVDGGCYEEDVAIGCKDDKTVVNVPSTLKMVSKILLIISSILIIGGIGLITVNYIKARRERK